MAGHQRPKLKYYYVYQIQNRLQLLTGSFSKAGFGISSTPSEAHATPQTPQLAAPTKRGWPPFAIRTLARFIALRKDLMKCVSGMSRRADLPVRAASSLIIPQLHSFSSFIKVHFSMLQRPCPSLTIVFKLPPYQPCSFDP